MNIIIETLIIEDDRPQHIEKHKVTIREILEIVNGNYVFIKGKYDRWLLIGKTKKKRFLTIVVGARKQKDVYGLVTARPSSRDERNFYLEYTIQIGGDK